MDRYIHTDSVQKSSPSFGLYRSFSEVQSVSYIITILFRSPVHLLDYTIPFQTGILKMIIII
jgi:hypothetical protein